MALRGLKAFDEYYASIYGTRWEALKSALLSPVRHIARLNKFAPENEIELRFPNSKRKNIGNIEWIDLDESLKPETTSRQVHDFYKMDLASVYPALALDVKPGDQVLDMCAAPGGKSLILAEALRNGEGGLLLANEISDNRRIRLSRVIREYVPAPENTKVKVTGHDASRWCLREKDAFDRVLLDAPCSGERHLLEDPAEMKTWSEARSKNLSVRQYSLLASALQVVKPGGRIVYSTCSLSQRENDDLISRLLKRRSGEAKVISETAAPLDGERTEHGWLVLPDKTGYGPIYYSVLQRL